MPVVLFSLLLAFTGLSSANANECTVEDVGRCTFYMDCVEINRPCGVEGYALAYGYKYCNIFKSTDFKRELTRNWRDKTMSCLQLELLDFNVASKTCEEVKTYAYDTHPNCYVLPDPTTPEVSICNISRLDVLKIFRLIRAKDSLSRSGLRQIKKVAELCFDEVSRDKELSDETLEQLYFWESQLFELQQVD